MHRTGDDESSVVERRALAGVRTNVQGRCRGDGRRALTCSRAAARR